jgi:murein DD-endopeptidase MepM/ murein hydrolase activator NlpD
MKKRFMLSIIPNQPGGKRHPVFFIGLLLLLAVFLITSAILFIRLFKPSSSALIRRGDVRALEKENIILKKAEEEITENLEETKEKIEELRKTSEHIEPLIEAQQLPENEEYTFEGFTISEILDSLVKVSELNRKVFSVALEKLENNKRKATAIPSILPVDGSMYRGYGYVTDLYTDQVRFHPGITFSARKGSPVYATGDGSIIRGGMENGIGLFVEINHGFGYITKYGHLQAARVEEGDFVKRGDIIGYVGKTGRVMGPCLYYEVILSGKRENPGFFIFEEIGALEPEYTK